jgi:hypothetical protein
VTYHRHFVFTNFTQFGVNQPAYINIIRDPIQREVSKLYVLVQNIRALAFQFSGASHLAVPQLLSTPDYG